MSPNRAGPVGPAISLVEALTDAPAYQTFDPKAQDSERQIRRVWSVFRDNPEAHAGARALRPRLDDLAREIREPEKKSNSSGLIFKLT